ncbi:MAG TPA: phosphotransferase family protein [Acidimicrobiales bacterium]|nr:phosphotransferase family protein [Acidimicrobiales bacterium]
MVVLGAGDEQLGHRRHRADDSLGNRMGISRPRDLDAVRAGLTRWVGSWRPDARDVRLAPLVQPATGLSSETIFVEVDWTLGSGRGHAAAPEHASWVVRLPPHGEGLFPSYDLAMQGRLQAVLAGAGVPAVDPLAVEEDDGWVGAPFLVMPRVAGQVVRADQPYLRAGFLAEATPEGQARLHGHVVDVLAQIHRLDWEALGCGDILGPPGGLAEALEHWAGYLTWAGEGHAPGVFDEGLEWCRAHLPRPQPPPSLLWGDVQLGNVLVDADMGVSAVLDFEMASIGPAEVDLAWFVVLHDMAVDRCGGDLPGFPGRDATVAAYQDRLGRPLTDLRWYEAFAALRSGAILVRAARLLARLGVDDSWLTHQNPTIDLLAELIAS